MADFKKGIEFKKQILVQNTEIVLTKKGINSNFKATCCVCSRKFTVQFENTLV